eukprot:scaffold212835_cov17-Tisochrysis_lutea.AAC.1
MLCREGTNPDMHATMLNPQQDLNDHVCYCVHPPDPPTCLIDTEAPPGQRVLIMHSFAPM